MPRAYLAMMRSSKPRDRRSYLPSSTGQSRLALPSTRLARALDAFAPDVMHVHTFLSVGCAAASAARRRGVPLAGTNHWSIEGFARYVPGLGRAVGRFVLQAVGPHYERCAPVTALSQAALAEMRRAGLSAATVVISNGIDTRL